MALLLLTEAQRRAELIEVTSYDIVLDLDTGDETFESTTTVTFTCREPGESTFLDLKAHEVHEIRLNGSPIDPAEVSDGRVTLSSLRGDNEVFVRATMAYSRDGQGLHRSTDPADGQDYVYGHLFLDAAPAVYACFDQPDLKAPYDVRVTAPEHWQVMGNGDRERLDERTWKLATTKPLSTYFVTVCAGPYATVEDEHDGIPLFVHARASMGELLTAQAPEILDTTKRCFDEYHRLFGIRYPFGQYHQVFVPEFNAGAMENPGCVTFRDQYIFRGNPSRDELLARSNTIAHEMAHMWFGDMVTLKWWDDLWLNESFAEYMAHRVMTVATDFSEAWVDFSIARKQWGYAAERCPSTHPVAANTPPDAQTALQNFDGISYAKGASVLRQLIAYIGDETFIAGVSDYLRSHLYGNATLADFMASMEKAAGRSLQDWAQEWLRTASLDTLRLDLTSEDGVITAATVHRDVPEAHPADRPHTLDIAGWTDGEQLWTRQLTVHGDATAIPELVGQPMPALAIPNSSDLTWATAVLSAETVAALPEQLAQIPEPGVRSVIWLALIDGVCLAQTDPRDLLAIFAAAWPQEDNTSILNRVATFVTTRLVRNFLPEAEQAEAWTRVADAASRLLKRVGEDHPAAIPAARLLAAFSADEARVCDWAQGRGAPSAVDGDTDFTWIALRNLAGKGQAAEDDIAAMEREDQTLSGKLNAFRARASVPTAEAKAWAWDQIVGDHGRSNYELNSLGTGFWEGSGLEHARPYAARFFTEVPRLAGKLGEDALHRVVLYTYPAPIVDEQTVALAQTTLAEEGLSAAVRRGMVDMLSEQEEALASRQRFGG